MRAPLLTALALALALLLGPLPTRAQDRGWSVERETTSPIDGKRTLLISARRDELRISVGCNLSMTFVTVHFGRALLPASRQLVGRYRVDQQPPADVSWDASASDASTIQGDGSKDLILALIKAAVWHIRVGEEERSIDVRGLSVFEAKLREACRL